MANSFEMDDGLQVTGDFPTGSAGEISVSDEGLCVVAPKPEPVPDWFFEALQVNFGGAGVPREYAFHIRVTSDSARSLRFRFVFSETNGANYMDPPYWILREGEWFQVPHVDTQFEAKVHAEISVDIKEGETIQLANKPYPTLDRVDREVDELVSSCSFFTRCVYGETAEGRPLVALETEPRDESILINATMQPAEPAAVPILSIAHWLADRSTIANRLLDRFQFCFIPLPNPDGSFHGRSVTNGKGEVPMFSFGRHLSGASAPEETVAFWDYASMLRPAGHLELHTHYQDTRFHKLNPLSREWFPEAVRGRLAETTRSMLSVNDQWRVTELAKDTPIVTAGKFVNMGTHFQTFSYCYQIYTATVQSTCSQAVAAARALAEGLAGETWCSDIREPEIVKG